MQTALNLRTGFLLLKSPEHLPHFGWSTGPNTVVFVAADTCSASKEWASYKSGEAGPWCREPRLAVSTYFRSMTNRMCGDIVFFLHLPCLQWWNPRGFINTSTRTRGCVYMSSLVLLMSAIWLEITQSSPFTMLWFALWSHLRVHNLDSF